MIDCAVCSGLVIKPNVSDGSCVIPFTKHIPIGIVCINIIARVNCLVYRNFDPIECAESLYRHHIVLFKLAMSFKSHGKSNL